MFAALIVSPNLFGVLNHDVNSADQVLHAGVALVSVAIGALARGQAAATA